MYLIKINEQAVISLPMTGDCIMNKFDLEHDLSADTAAHDDAYKDSLCQVIRSGLYAVDYLEQISEAASLDNNIIDLQKKLFAGGLGVTLAQAQQNFANEWLDKLAQEKAQLVLDGKEPVPWEFDF